MKLKISTREWIKNALSDLQDQNVVELLIQFGNSLIKIAEEPAEGEIL